MRHPAAPHWVRKHRPTRKTSRACADVLPGVTKTSVQGSESGGGPSQSAKAQGKHSRNARGSAAPRVQRAAGSEHTSPQVALAARILLCLLAFPAHAGVYATYPDDALAAVHLRNEATFGGAGQGTHTFETDLGPVTVRQFSTSNGPNGCCPDMLEVVDFPPGSLASPPSIRVEEGQLGTILIRKFEGM